MMTQTSSTRLMDRQDQVSDERLVLSCRRGEAEAWNTLVNRYQRLIYTVPRRAGLDEDQSAEVFQRTFAILLENLDRIRKPESIHAWLVTTARRETLQLIRQQNMERFFPQSDEPDGRFARESTIDDKPRPDETIESLEEQSQIRGALEALDERCRCLLSLLYFQPDPPSYSEIAAVLNMPEGSLGPTRARCLKRLRQWLQAADF
jgi:RNA polymerase sigma factor (sigma-70 family)